MKWSEISEKANYPPEIEEGNVVVVREIPNDKVLDLGHRLCQSARVIWRRGDRVKVRFFGAPETLTLPIEDVEYESRR